MSKVVLNQGQATKALAHDIRGMLATVQLAVDRLMLHEDSAVRKQCLLVEKVIDKATEYCSDTVCDFRVKDNAGVSSSKLAQDVDLILKPLAQHENVDYNVIYVETIIPKHIYIKLHRILVNLGRNSINAQKGQASARLLILIDVVDNMLKIDVIDNGPGIADNIIHELSERIKNPMSSKKKNLGMGLTSSYAFISQLNGHIDIINTGQTGTKFQLEIPLRKVTERNIVIKKDLELC